MSAPFPQLSRIEYIPLQLIDLHPLARKHSPESLAALQSSMSQEGQLQNIVVCPRAGGRYEVIAGAGRFSQAKAARWDKILASIREGLTEVQKLELMLSENEDREAESPVHKAEVYQAMMKAGNLTQEELAKQEGVSKQTVSDYVSLTDLPEGLKQESARADFLSLKHYLQILRLKTAADQVQMAEKAEKEEWSVKELTAQVNRKLGKGSIVAPNRVSPMPDPLADFWFQVQLDPQKIGQGTWGVSYGPHKLIAGKGPTVPAWSFWTSGNYALTPKAALAVFFREMLKALGDTAAEEKTATDRMAHLSFELAEGTNPIQDGKGTRQMPASEGEFQQMQADQKKIKMPQTPAEWSRYESLYVKGPEAFYREICGPDSYYAKKARGTTWRDVGMKDGPEGCREMMRSWKQAMDAASLGSSPEPSASPGDGPDSEIEAMIARRKAKRNSA